MDIRVMCSNHQNNPEANVEHDLWAALLEAEGVSCSWTSGEPLTEKIVTVEEDPHAKIAYPWNPAKADDFFAELEQESLFEDWQSEEITARSKSFFAHLDRLWAASSNNLQATLTQRFAARIPQNLLATIAQRAQHLVSSSLSLSDQLVQCVQDILPNLTELVEEDLYVLARPLAGAMRDSGPQQAVDSALASVRPLSWEELSETEQARLSLIIARYALAELNQG